MKKLFALLFLVMSLAGCGSSKEDDPAVITEPTVSAIAGTWNLITAVTKSTPKGGTTSYIPGTYGAGYQTTFTTDGQVLNSHPDGTTDGTTNNGTYTLSGRTLTIRYSSTLTTTPVIQEWSATKLVLVYTYVTTMGEDIITVNYTR
jgi:hypothetical protein